MATSGGARTQGSIIIQFTDTDLLAGQGFEWVGVGNCITPGKKSRCGYAAANA